MSRTWYIRWAIDANETKVGWPKRIKIGRSDDMLVEKPRMRTLNLLVLRCADMEKSKLFYECFDMMFSKHAHQGGPEHYACEDNGGVFEFIHQQVAQRIARESGF